MFSKIAFSVKNGPFRHIFHIDSAKYRAFFRQSEMLASKQHYLGKKNGNFSYVINAKCFSFYGLRKCVASKEHMTFCIIQRKAKSRCILLIQIFFTSLVVKSGQSAHDALHGVASQCCRNSARYDVKCCRNSAKFDGPSVQKFCTP